MPVLGRLGLAHSLQDAFALADALGPGTVIALGKQPSSADIFAPSGLTLTEAETTAALTGKKAPCFISAGNYTAPETRTLSPLLEHALQHTGAGFISACFAAPEHGRTVYHGNLFQDGRLLANLHHEFSGAFSGRVALIAHPTVAQGPAAIRRAIAAAREQGVALALIDAIDLANCMDIAKALQNSLLAAGPAWLAARVQQTQPDAPTVPAAILSGALDRQTLYQLGAARVAMPFLQLALPSPNIAAALAWAQAQTGSFIIATSAPPDRITPGAPAADILGQIAAGLADIGTRRFLVTGNGTAAAILARLGIKTLTTGAPQAGLRWFHAGEINLAFKPSGFGERNLFEAEFGPQIRLNATAECAS